MKILLGVTSSVAVYKALSIASEFNKRGCTVHVVMTENAAKLVSPILFETITGNKVHVSLMEDDHRVVHHVSLPDEVDVCLIAPATYNVVGKVASGIADDFLTTMISATKKEVYFALAMNNKMYENKILKDNVEKLKGYGYKFIEPEEGYLACGYNAKGRLADIDTIVSTILDNQKPLLKGKKVLVTAGATREYLDPIRFISNKSSGLMGYSLANYAKSLGADVTVLSANVNLDKTNGIKYCEVETVVDLDEEMTNYFDEADMVFMTAAVSDYKANHIATKKIKKSDDDLNIKLARTNDLLKKFASNKGSKQIVVGFAAESENLLKNAKSKLERKNLDFVVANHVDNFSSDDNEVIIVSNQETYKVTKASKDKIAKKIIDHVIEKRGL